MARKGDKIMLMPDNKIIVTIQSPPPHTQVRIKKKFKYKKGTSVV
jgi:hypothetical protein